MLRSDLADAAPFVPEAVGSQIFAPEVSLHHRLRCRCSNGGHGEKHRKAREWGVTFGFVRSWSFACCVGDATLVCEDGEQGHTEPLRTAVSIGDVTSNLLRPCFHRAGLSGKRLFFFDGEPIDRRSYSCLCAIESENGVPLEFRELRFDAKTNTVSAVNGQRGDHIVWAAALVPLVVDGRVLSATSSARHD